MSISPVYAAPLQHHSTVLPPPTETTPVSPAGMGTTASPHETALLNAYLAAVQRKVLRNDAGLVKVPPQSTLGQWLELYRAQVEHPVVQGWMRDQKIDPSALLSIDPFKGTLSAEVDGKAKTFSLSDTSGWGQVSGPLLAAAKVIAPEDKGALRVRFGDGFTQVSAKVVANFQGIALPKNRSQASEQIRHLAHQKAFDPVPSDDRLRPASSRSAQALEVQKANAAKFYSSAPQALEYKRLAVDVATNLPNTRAEAKKWAEKLIFELTGKHVDADTIYLNRFKNANTPFSQATATVTGWEHPNEEPYSSLSLPDALLKNFNEHDGVPGNLDQEAGLYLVGAGQSEKGGYGAHNQFPLTPSALMHASWKTDFQAQMTQKIDNFWDARSEDYSTAIKGEFVYQARKQIKANDAKPAAERALQPPEHQLTREDYRLVMGAASNLPLDEHSPLSVEQLKAKAPVKGIVQAHAFNIHGFASSDMLRFSGADGRQVLYMPGAEPAFLRFDSREKLDQWVVDQTKAPKKREALLSHFPLAYRQDHEAGFAARAAKVLMPLLWFSHVGDKTEGLDTLFEKMASGKLKGPGIDDGHSKVEGDVFATLTTATKERMKSDADVVIKSNSEVIRDTWLNDITVAASLLAKLAPIAAPVAGAAVITGLAEVVLGVEKNSSGDTEAERKDGASKAFDGVLNTLFSIGASGSVEDPFMTPEEKPGIPISSERPKVETPQTPPEVDRIRPSLSGNISAHAVSNGEQLLKNATRNGKGIYQVKDPVSGADHWYIRYADSTGARQVYEIKGDFKLSNDYVQIINRETGRPVLTVHSDGNGEWVHAAANGGVRWPWQRASSPTPSDSLDSQFSDLFADVDEQAVKQAKTFDTYLNVDEATPYSVSTRGYEDHGVLKRKLNLSWEGPEEKVEIYESEKASPTNYSNSHYSPNFILDLNRNDYTVIKASKNGEEVLPLNAGGGSAEAIRQNRIQQFESAIPNADLRARISEVAHQGSVFPANAELIKTLKEGYGAKASDTSYFVDYDPLQNEATVRVVAKWYINDLTGDNPRAIPDIEATTTRTFTIRESNEVTGDAYVIDDHAPTRLEVSVPADLPK